MPGPAPKPANIRARQNRKSTATTLVHGDGVSIPAIPNPDNRKWHVLTTHSWEHAWQSPMAGQWMKTDEDALGRLALLWDDYYNGDRSLASEIRLQEQRWGLSPLDRSRLQWEFNRADESNQKQQRREQSIAKRGGSDPRAALMVVQ